MTVQVNGIAAVGDVLAGKYRVDKILGIGGMGMVVAATHLELDQRVALKFMLPASDTPDTFARFMREARAAGRLNSDHVCRVMDVGRFDSGTPYIVMEYLQGENFGALLRRRGPLRVSEAVDYLLQAIEGIAEAHVHGIIHRDLKPDNLFLHKRNDGGATVKVLDFGISKATAAGVSTRTGDIMGSPAYMAPEQMESSRNVDQRADVWSLGVVLYQMVTGKPPFQGDTLPLLCLSVVNDEPAEMSAIRGDLPDGFEAIVMRCLRKEPIERFADVGELAQALAAFGPKHATTSASRIQIVLRRALADSAALISSEFSRIDPSAAGIAPPVPLENDGRITVQDRRELSSRHVADDAAEPAALPSAPVVLPPGALSIPSLAAIPAAPPRPARRRDGRSRLIGALIGSIVLVMVAIVVVLTGRTDELVVPAPAALANPAPTPIPAAAVPSAAPIVEPIIDPPAEPAPPGAEPAAREPTVIEMPVAAAPTDPPARKADQKKRKPPRSGGAASRARGPREPKAEPTGAGSASPDEDDKWMHMTHDEKKP